MLVGDATRRAILLVDWDRRFLELAQHIAGWSKDPSTQVGAVIIDDIYVKAVGYNGFPPGIKDDDRLLTRETKYPIIVHAEANALLNLQPDRTLSYTLYTWPAPPCSRCATLILSSRYIRCIVSPILPERMVHWADDIKLADSLFEEAGIHVERRT